MQLDLLLFVLCFIIIFSSTSEVGKQAGEQQGLYWNVHFPRGGL